MPKATGKSAGSHALAKGDRIVRLVTKMEWVDLISP